MEAYMNFRFRSDYWLIYYNKDVIDAAGMLIRPTI